MGGTLYLTPDTIPSDFVCRRVRIPNEINFIAAVNAALRELCLPWRWFDNGGVSVSDAVDAANALFEEFLVSGGACMIGVVFPFVSLSVPSGSLLCDGSSYSRLVYPLLYNALDPVFILDEDTFVVPDLRGRVVIGAGEGLGLTDRSVGVILGEETHVLTVTETAVHSHSDGGHSHSEITASATVINGGLEAPAASAIPGLGSTGTGFADIGDSGGDGAHNNMQPSLALNWAVWFQ